MSVYDTLLERGYIEQVTNEEQVRELLEKPGLKFYIGFDPTANSLHIGHFIQLMVMAHMQRAGHIPVCLIGGGTTMIGDPSGRTDLRKVLSKDEIKANGEKFNGVFENFLDFSDNKAILVNNADWILDLNYIDFLREIGSQFSVNKMLTAECYKQRMEKGLTFLEFNYMLLQAYDFYRLFKDYDVLMEFGGNDQWSNILAGIDLIRRKLQKEAYGMTFSLLTTSEGIKMGKTAKGALWLDKNKTSPYEFFQYFRNVSDLDVEKCLKLLTFLSLEEINDLTSHEGQALNKAKEVLAYEVTKLVHGEEEAKKALEASKSLFTGEASSENIPQVVLEMDEPIGLLNLLVKAGLANSNKEARTLITQGGIRIDGEKIDNPKTFYNKEDFSDYRLIKKGKKVFKKVKVE